MQSLLFWILFLLFALSANCADKKKKKKKNVLFIMSEDMRPDLSFYGTEGVIAPNLERLAQKSLVFDLATPQVSICAPSRASMLTGLRPDTSGIFDFMHFGGFRFFRTIPSHFSQSGYNTGMSGKYFHYESPKHYNMAYYGAPTWEVIQQKEMKFHNSSVTPDALHESSDKVRGNYIAWHCVILCDMRKTQMYIISRLDSGSTISHSPLVVACFQRETYH